MLSRLPHLALFIALSAQLASACSANQQPAPSAPRVEEPQAAQNVSAEGASDSASFADLIESLPHLPASERTSPLFRIVGDEAQLNASPAIPIRPLPPLEEDIAARLLEAREVEVFSPFGRIGESPLKVATLSRIARPFAKAVVLGLERERVYFHGRAYAVDELVERLEALDASTLIVLVASPETRLLELAKLSNALEARLANALAIGLLLPYETRFGTRDGKEPRGAEEWRCHEGSMVLSGPPGALDPASLGPAVSSLHQAISACGAHEPPTWFETERRSTLRIKVDAEGAVAAACFEGIDESERQIFERFARCTLRQLRALRFPAPDPAGEVFFTLPVRFMGQ